MSNPKAPKDSGRKASWTFLSNHAHVLVCLARDPDTRLRDVADEVGITERGVFKIVTDLEEGGVITRLREGRRNHYEIDTAVTLRHPLEAHRTVGSLLETLLRPGEAKRLGLLQRPARPSKRK
ncbi:MAG: winged helix-turn-helix transcriptional regulator [Myxococcales bacterium]|nr:winged helix-turn-helix transcriptional regulator [Myxococcales bacterium]